MSDTLQQLINKKINEKFATNIVSGQPQVETNISDSEKFLNIFQNAGRGLQQAFYSTQVASLEISDYLGFGNEFMIDNLIKEKYSDIEKLNKKMEYTGKGIVGGFKDGDVSDIGLGITNALTSVVTTVVPAMLTRGASLVPQIAAPMYTEYNMEKAKNLYGKYDVDGSIKKLLDNNEDEVLAPVVLGLTAAALERVGYKGITNYMLDRAKTQGVKRIIGLVSTGNREGLTEYFQGGLNAANKALAIGKNPIKSVFNHLTSQQALEEYLQGFVGGTGISASGRAINNAIRSDQDNLIINSYITKLGALQQEKVMSKTQDAKKAIDKKIKEAENEFRDFLIKKRKKSKFVTKEQADELISNLESKKQLNKKLENIENQFRNGEINQNEYNIIVEDINKDIQALNKKAETIRIEANKKFLTQDLSVTKTAISKVLGLEQKVYKTEQEFLDAYNAKTGKNLTLNDIEGVDGVKVGDEIMINLETAAKTNAVTVGSHELLHAILKSSLTSKEFRKITDKDGNIIKDTKGNAIETDLTEEGEKLIRDFLNTLSKKERAVVDKRINNNYKFNEDGSEKEFAEYAEEYLNAYADAAIKNELTDSILVKIGNFLSKIFNKGDKGYKNLKFKTGEDVKAFLKAYVSDAKKGEFRQEFIDLAQEGVDQGPTTKKIPTKKTGKGRKQIDKIKKDYEAAKTPEEKLNIIQRFINNVYQGSDATQEEIDFFNNEIKALKKEGFELEMNFQPGTQLSEGDIVDITASIPDNTLPEGVTIVSRVSTPGIIKDGKKVNRTVVETRKGTKKSNKREALVKEVNRAQDMPGQGKNKLEAIKKARQALSDFDKQFQKTFNLADAKGKQSSEFVEKKSMSREAKQQISDNVKEIGDTYSFEGGKKAWNEGGADNAITEIKQNNYLDDLIAAKFKGDRVPVDFVDKVYTELTSHIRNFNPETNDNLFGWINSQIGNKAGNVFNREYKTTTEQRTAKDVDDRTKEGEVKVQVEAEQDITLQELEELDLSPQAVAKREAQENKRKETVYSKLRQKLGIETGSELYNRVLDASKKALIRAYEVGKPVRKIQRDLKDAANTYIFKEIKNMLGVGKNYIPTIKNLRESIVESMFVADLVQMERNVPDSEKVFTRFVKNLTSKQEVQDAVDQNKLPPSALNTIDKGQSVALYEKVMPTENEFVGFFDQPLVTAQGVRSGLKGTRKDQLAKYLANSLSLDAMLQVAQDPEVAQKRQDFAELRGESIAENDLQVLAATIGRDVNVKFSKSNAVTDIDAAIDNSENTDVYLQIKFSKSHRDQYEARLEKKRPDLTEDQRKKAVQSVFDFIDGKDIPNNKKAKYEKMAMHYMANGYLILPEDGYKVIEADRIAGIKKIDPLSYKNPNVLIEENVADVKGKKTNPDKVKTFTNKTEYGNGVVVYDVEDSKQGQEDVRKVIDTHFGKKANPWCLCARDERVDQQYKKFDNKQEAKRYADEMKARGYKIEIGVLQNEYEVFADLIGDKSKELDAAFGAWKSYNKQGNGFKIAFHNGNLVSFRDGNNMKWWDRMDKPTDAVVVKGKKVGDGFREVIQVDENKTTLLYTEKQIGDSKTGSYTKKNLDGDIVEIITTKNGFKDGKQFEVIDKVYYNAEFTTIYENGDAIRKEEVRTPYKKIKGKAKTERIGVGNDELRLKNITKWKRVIIKESPGKSYVELEGTVSQSYFEQAQNPEAITDPFIKKNFNYLVESNQRYFPLQDKKVSVVKKSKPQSFLPDGEVTIDGEVQTEKVKFSKSAVNDVKFSLSELQQDRKTLPAILKKQLEVEQRVLDNPTAEDIYLLEKLNDLEIAIKDNVSYKEAFETFLNGMPQDVSSLLVDFKDINSFENYIKNVSVPAIRTLGFKAAKTYFKNKFDSLTETKDKVDLIASFLKNIGISVRAGKGLEVSFINQELLDGPITDIFGKEFVSKHFKIADINEGGKKGKTITYSYDGKKGSFEKVSLYKDIDAIKNSRGESNIVTEVNREALEAREFVNEIIESDLSISEKLAIIDLLSLNQRGAIRKMYMFGETVTEQVKTPSIGLVLEHEITVKNMTKYLRQRVKGILSESQLKEIVDQAKVHVWPKQIDTILNEQKLRQEGGRSRYQNVKVKKYLQNLANKGQITNMPNKLQEVNNLKEAVKFSRSTKNPTKGITILDFDDTLATSASLIKFTRPDGTKGTLTPEQYASTYESLLDLDYKFDFSEFSKVVDGKPAPLLNKAKKLAGKFGTKNMFILTARPADSALAIQKFLKENGLNIPLENITGLGNSTAEAKAMWVLGKVSEGYNDFYFADDAIQNVKEVKNVLEQVDVKSKVQQAKLKFSKSLDKDFNDIIQDVKGIESKKRFSEAKGRARGQGKGRFRFFIPPSHEDFVGLLYNFIGFGEKGNKHRDFFEKALIKPLNRAFRELNVAKQAIANDYRALVKSMPEVRKRLGEKILKSDYTVEDAIRVYLFDKAGFEIPGLTKTDLKNLTNFVKQNSDILQFADQVGKISRVEEGYISPGDSWQASNIRYDLVDATGRVGRAKFFTEFQENVDIIFSDENMNKIRAAFGDNFVEALQDMLYRIKTGNNRPTGNNRIVNKFLDWINGSVGATMFFNARSAVLQTLSTVNFINFGDNNIFKAAAAFANQKQFWKDFSFLFNSDFLKQRRSGAAFDVNANEIAREVAGSKNPVLAAIKYLLNIGFLPTQLADSFAIASGGSTFYRNRINSYLKQGLSQQEAESKAFIDFQEIAEATQQSARPDMVSQQQTSTLGRIILAFQNVTAQYARLIKKATLDLVNRRRSRSYQTQIQSDMSNISRIIYYGAIQAVIFNALQNALFAMMFDEEEEDEKKTEKFFDTKKQRVINGTIDSLLKGLGVGGAVIATLKNYAIKLSENLKDDSFFKTPAWEQLLQLSPPIGIKIRKIARAERNLEWNKDVLTELPLDNLDNPIYETSATYIEGFTNVPTARLLRKIQNLNAALDSENKWWQRIALAAGWSRWDVGIQDNEMKEAKNAIRENNKRINKETKLKEATPEEKLKIVEKSVFDLNKNEQVKILEANNLNPKKYPKEADRVDAIMNLRNKNKRKIDSTITAIENYIPTEKEQRSIDLFKMNKKDQVNMLIDLGLSSKQIKKLKYEEDRVNKIIELQDKNKSKKR